MNVDELAKQSIQQRSLTVLHALAAGQYAFGQYQTALDLLDVAIHMDGNCAETYVMIARISYALGNLDESIDALDTAIECTSSSELSERDQIFERRIRLLSSLAEQHELFG